jgi:hypothetical protein
VQSTDAILNTTAANPPTITPNPAPITFAAGKVSHPFSGAGVGWLLVSAPTTAAAAPSGGTTAVATGTGGAAPTTLPKTGEAHAPGANRITLLSLSLGILSLLVGTGLFIRRRATGRC